jgi:dipeptidyl aminopeptidase/acylaminoacyl peptidase
MINRIGAAVLIVAGGLFTSNVRAIAAEPASIDVTYPNGQITLAAELMLPPGDQALPAVVIVQGSGRSDRTNRWSRDIANELLAMGVAVLLTDKRGSGASEGNWQTASFEELATDVLAGSAYLQTLTEIDSTRIGIVGLSQGGQVVAIAAARSNSVAFVVNISGKAVGFSEGSFTEMANTARESGFDENAVSAVLALNREAALFAVGGPWASYETARRQALDTPIRGIAEGFPSTRDAPIWTFLQSVATFDPLSYWVLVEQPVLIVYGEADEQDNVPVAESVRRLTHAFGASDKRNYEILVVPGATHGIRDPATNRLAPLFTKRLGEWLVETAGVVGQN